MSSRVFVAGLAIILAGAAWLRLHRLSAEGVWLDEASSIAMASEPLTGLVADTAADVHPPLYYIALHYWMRAVGASEGAVRGLSVLFGLAGIAAAGVFARRLFGPATALITAAVLATSPFHLYHSQQARMYALLALTATLSMHGFVALLRRRPSRLPSIGYGTATVLMLYTHVYGLFIVAAQHLYVAAMWMAARRGAMRFVRHWAVVHAVVLIAFVPWGVVLVQQFVRVNDGFWIERWPNWLLPYTFVVQAGSWPLAAVMVPLAALAGIVAWRPAAAGGPWRSRLRSATREQWRVLLLALWFAGPVLLPFALSQIFTPIFLPKYTLISAVALAMLAAHGIVLLRSRLIQVLTATVLATCAAASLGAYYDKTQNDRWREAVSEFHAHAAAGDLVLFTQPWGQIPFDYYLKRRDIVERALPPALGLFAPDEIAAILDTAMAGHHRIWLVLSQSGELGAMLKDQLTPEQRLRLESKHRGVELYLYER